MYGCLFYLTGKIARAMSALERSDNPSDDTLFDATVYAMFARAYLERGGLQ